MSGTKQERACPAGFAAFLSAMLSFRAFGTDNQSDGGLWNKGSGKSISFPFGIERRWEDAPCSASRWHTHNQTMRWSLCFNLLERGSLRRTTFINSRKRKPNMPLQQTPEDISDSFCCFIFSSISTCCAHSFKTDLTSCHPHGSHHFFPFHLAI